MRSEMPASIVPVRYMAHLWYLANFCFLSFFFLSSSPVDSLAFSSACLMSTLIGRVLSGCCELCSAKAHKDVLEKHLNVRDCNWGSRTMHTFTLGRRNWRKIFPFDENIRRGILLHVLQRAAILTLDYSILVQVTRHAYSISLSRGQLSWF